jgi:hypothetical protein
MNMCRLSQVKCSTKKDPFPLPFQNSILDYVGGHEMYFFMDGYSGYNQVKMAEKDKEKTTFILKWGPYAYIVIPLGYIMSIPKFLNRLNCESKMKTTEE